MGTFSQLWTLCYNSTYLRRGRSTLVKTHIKQAQSKSYFTFYEPPQMDNKLQTLLLFSTVHPLFSFGFTYYYCLNRGIPSRKCSTKQPSLPWKKSTSQYINYWDLWMPHDARNTYILIFDTCLSKSRESRQCIMSKVVPC